MVNIPKFSLTMVNLLKFNLAIVSFNQN
jgi:hypothetical protein